MFCLVLCPRKHSRFLGGETIHTRHGWLLVISFLPPGVALLVSLFTVACCV